MIWKNNLSDLNLIFNEPILFSGYVDENALLPVASFHMRIPTVAEVYCDSELQLVTSVLNTDVDVLQKQFPFIQNLSTHFSLYNILLTMYKTQVVLQRYVDNLLEVWQRYGIPIALNETQSGFILNDEPLYYDAFCTLQRAFLVAMQLKKAKDYADIDPQYAEMQKKINRIKQSGQNAMATDNNNASLFDSIASLAYEFGFDIETIKRMNIFQFNQYLKYVPGAINHRISTIAAGNGLTKKKVRYITDKGKK